MSDPLYIGDVANVRVVFAPRLSNGALGAPADPTTVRIKVQTPSGAEKPYVYLTDVEVVRESAGNYLLALKLRESGEYVVKGIGTGSVECGSPDTIVRVEKSRFKNPL